MEDPTPARDPRVSNWASLSLHLLLCKTGQVSQQVSATLHRQVPTPGNTPSASTTSVQKAGRQVPKADPADLRDQVFRWECHPESWLSQGRAWPRPPGLPPGQGSAPSDSWGGSWVRGWSEMTPAHPHTTHLGGTQAHCPTPLPISASLGGWAGSHWGLQHREELRETSGHHGARGI